jgi:hypothetical protein
MVIPPPSRFAARAVSRGAPGSGKKPQVRCISSHRMIGAAAARDQVAEIVSHRFLHIKTGISRSAAIPRVVLQSRGR